MNKPTKNPWVIEKTKSSFDRQCPLSSIPYVIRSDGTKGCIWCGDDLKTKHPAQRYCKDPECSKAAYIWGYPQSQESLVLLLKKQDWKCASCPLDYRALLISQSMDLDKSPAHITAALKRLNQSVWPEVDHIVPIIKGGPSLGSENHQVLCYSCHKVKTKLDVKGPKRVKSKEEILKQIDQRLYKKIASLVAQNWNFDTLDSEAESERYLKIFENFLNTLPTEEIEALTQRPDRFVLTDGELALIRNKFA